MRRLPPLNALRAFEAVSRHGSLSRAAEELLVTVSPPKGGFMAVTVVRRVSTEGNRPPIVE